MKNNHKKGFTLAETLIIFLLLSVMLAAFAPMMTKKVTKKVNTKCPTGINKLFVEYTLPGTYTFTAPANITGEATVTLIGGGGGGAGGKIEITRDQNGVAYIKTVMLGGAGGGGAYLEEKHVQLVGGQTYNIKVGEGGAGSAVDSGAGGSESCISTAGPSAQSQCDMATTEQQCSVYVAICKWGVQESGGAGGGASCKGTSSSADSFCANYLDATSCNKMAPCKWKEAGACYSTVSDQSAMQMCAGKSDSASCNSIAICKWGLGNITAGDGFYGKDGENTTFGTYSAQGGSGGRQNGGQGGILSGSGGTSGQNGGDGCFWECPTNIANDCNNLAGTVCYAPAGSGGGISILKNDGSGTLTFAGGTGGAVCNNACGNIHGKYGKGYSKEFTSSNPIGCTAGLGGGGGGVVKNANNPDAGYGANGGGGYARIDYQVKCEY